MKRIIKIIRILFSPIVFFFYLGVMIAFGIGLICAIIAAFELLNSFFKWERVETDSILMLFAFILFPIGATITFIKTGEFFDDY